MNPVTSGPMVNDRLETGIEVYLPAATLLHVHDLVDYVSEEAALAGQNAAKYVKSGETKKGHSVTLKGRKWRPLHGTAVDRYRGDGRQADSSFPCGRCL